MQKFSTEVQDLVRSRTLEEPDSRSLKEYVTLPFREAKSLAEERGMSMERFNNIRRLFAQKVRDRSKALVKSCFEKIYPDSFEIAAEMELVRVNVAFGEELWQTQKSFMGQVRSYCIHQPYIYYV
jgi:hypothetical protein